MTGNKNNRAERQRWMNELLKESFGGETGGDGWEGGRKDRYDAGSKERRSKIEIAAEREKKRATADKPREGGKGEDREG